MVTASSRVYTPLLKKAILSLTLAMKTDRTRSVVGANWFVRAGITWGMGVSRGYQAARRGRRMCLGGEERLLDLCLPLLEKVAAKDARGRPCIGRCGMDGSGQYVTMLYDGSEHGTMAAQVVAWQIMSLDLGMRYDEIGAVSEEWNEEGELVCGCPI